MNGLAETNTNGETQAKLRFKVAGESDKIAGSIIEELQRRGYVVIEAVVEGNVVLSPIEPEDKKKVWFKTDVNKVPQGSPLTWKSDIGKWTPNDGSAYVAPDQRNGSQFVAAGGSVVTFGPFKSMKTTNYHVSLTATMLWDGIYHTPIVTFPDKYGYFLVNKAVDLFTVQFYGIPAGGLGFEWQITELP